MRRPPGAALIAALLLAGCSSEGPDHYASCADLRAVAAGEQPRALTLPEGATVTDVARKKGYTAITAVAESDVETLYEPMELALTTAGFEIIGREFEGLDAELFFSGGPERRNSAGVVRMRTGPCAEQVTLSVLYDPLDTKKGRAALARAKRTWTAGNRPSATPE